MLFFFINMISFFSVSSAETMRMQLIHRHSAEMAGNPKTQLQRLRELLHRDITRHSQKLTARRKAWERNVSSEMAMRSGADDGTAEYFVAIKVGTPAQKFLLIADTGSDLTWMNCNRERRRLAQQSTRRRRRRRRRVFHADRSSSFKSVPCSSDMCKIGLMNMFSLTQCPTPISPCAYVYSYTDGSSALGSFANETVTVGLTNGRKKRLHNILIGCTQSSKGQSLQVADGVMGLGYSNYSFTVQASRKFEHKFSYCLVDHLSPKNVSGHLTFGSTKKSFTHTMQFTDLILDVISPLYAVNIVGISLNDIILKIPFEVWDINGGGGTILDSGTSLTFLTLPAYQSVMTALKSSLLGFKKLDLNIGPLEYCFNSTGFNESVVPRLRFHFTGGARLEPPVKSYIIDAADGVKCLGFVSAAFPGTSVIGNIMQQNHLWEFNLAKRKLGFARSTCVN